MVNRVAASKNRTENLSKIKHSSLSGTRVGCVKIWKNNSYLHELVKCQIGIKLVNQGYEVIPEVEFEDGSGRADWIVIDKNGDAVAIEVLNSETEERFTAKEEVYPFPIIKVDAKEFDINSWEL